MDVKDIINSVALDSPSTDVRTGKLLPGGVLASPGSIPITTEGDAGESVTLQSTIRPETLSTNDIRSRTNDIISTGNLADSATAEIEKIVKSINGIVEQAQSNDITDKRRSTLEAEANNLVEEIKRRANVQSPSGVKPLNGDPIRLAVEEKLGRSLEIILPDSAKDAFGLGKIAFSTKESIIQTITSVQAAQQQLEDLRKAVNSTLGNLKSTVDEIEVASQNAEASQTSVRDLDTALKLAGETKLRIAANPQSALGSVGRLGNGALSLLE